jgi:hypothetical protein
MVRFEGKKSILLFCIFIFLPSVLLFLLSGSRSISEYIACFVILGAWVKSDDKYYRNLSLPYLLSAVVVGLGMVGLSWGLSLSLKNPDMLLSVNQPLVPGLSASPMSLAAMPTSITTIFLSSLLYGLVMAATAEELFKLTLFAEGKERWGKGYKLGKVMIPGILVYVGLPVGFWAALHSVQSYSDPVQILPAFVNGVVLIIYLWKTQCFLGCVVSHWLYNGTILALTCINGSASIAAGTPFFPAFWERAYYGNAGFIYDGMILVLLIAAVLFFLVPSLTNRDRSQRKR